MCALGARNSKKPTLRSGVSPSFFVARIISAASAAFSFAVSFRFLAFGGAADAAFGGLLFFRGGVASFCFFLCDGDSGSEYLFVVATDIAAAASAAFSRSFLFYLRREEGERG
jgi:hypothetical protein